MKRRKKKFNPAADKPTDRTGNIRPPTPEEEAQVEKSGAKVHNPSGWVPRALRDEEISLPQPSTPLTSTQPVAKVKDTRPEVELVEAAPIPMGITLVDAEAQRLRQILLERAKRKIEGLRLYQPMVMQEAFHSSRAPERILRGSNRAGKTLGAAVEIARAVTGQDPHNKYPKENGVCFCVGKDGKHLGDVLWRKLAHAGAFRIIRDEITQEWRTFRPNCPKDAARVKESKPAPPLIPPRLIKSIGWENKKENQPNLVTLTNGWVIRFFSSLGKPPQGSDIDLAWFDEEIIQKDWYPEMAARLVDRNGRFIWSATPQAGTEQLYNLHERSEEQRDRPDRTVEEFIVLLEDNTNLTNQQKQLIAEKLTDEERAVRIGGEFALLSFKVYPEFSPILHCCEPFQIPSSWTRYLSVDPGRQICAVLFVAVPRPDDGDFVYVYDELYIQNCDAALFGEKMATKVGHRQFESFLIDHQGARVTEMASGITIEHQYSEALRKHRIACNTTGCNFTWGNSNVKSGVEAFRDWLRIRDDGTTKVRIFGKQTPSGFETPVPNFVWELKHYRYKREGGIVTDEPESRGRVHQMANARYLASFRPRWVRPTGKQALSGAILAFRQKQKREGAGQNKTINLGPGK